MKKFEFNYSKKFKCIGSKCKHNCCIGWQINIDKKSLSLYQNLSKIDTRFNKDCFSKNSFNLNSKFTKNRRCPFLDGDNLCHIIKNYGEKTLCKTCKTHPRFKNFFTDRIETGLGLYCEQACRIILSFKPKMKEFLVKGDLNSTSLSPFEKKILSFRKKTLSIAQNRKLSINERIISLSKLSNINLDKNSLETWLNVYKNLEKLEINEFNFEMMAQSTSFAPIANGFERQYEQLLSYLIYRHLSRPLDLLDLRVRLGFVILSFNMINHIFSCQKEKTLDTLIEVCRFYSSEIETSDNNIFSLLNQIENLVSFI